MAAKIAYLIFKRYEPDKLLTTALLLIGIPVVLVFIGGHISLIPLAAVIVSFLVYYTTILTLLLIYRLGPWHPLANYPGPTWCKVSMIHMALKVVGGKRHEYIRALHDRYGDIVRSGKSPFQLSSFPLLTAISPGPNEVSIRDASAIAPLAGPTGLPKGPSESPFCCGRCCAIVDRAFQCGMGEVTILLPSLWWRSRIPWNIFACALFYLCWYWTVGFPSDAARAGYVFLALAVAFPLYYQTIGQAIAAMAPTAEIAALLFSFLFSFVLVL